MKTHITILGGGPAGLAVAYYAKKEGLSFTLHEAASEVGGLCRTFRHGEFLYDSGAHRFHAVLPGVTREVLNLMGGDMRKVHAPSQVYIAGKLVNFPLTPFNVARSLGTGVLVRAVRDLVIAKLRRARHAQDFEATACRRYGRTIAELFLLGYSEKLWGLSCKLLSPAVAGRRLHGLNLRTLLTEMVFGSRWAKHLDGGFLYPRLGYGMIMQRLAEKAGLQHIHTGSTVTRLRHDHRRVVEIEINHRQRVAVREVAVTLPLNRLLEMLDPAPPAPLLALGRRLRFRNMVLVAVFLNQPSVTPNASVYFPETRFPFTRVFVPRNRSALMAPRGRTCLVAELPCWTEDKLWQASDDEISGWVLAALGEIGWARPEAVIGTAVHRLSGAYPVLDAESERAVARIAEYLATFQNIRITGRNALFTYTHLHDQMQSARELVDEYSRPNR
ncbi:MAG: FAD-dependent oxidoreductase [Verrucomicrobia bacterium]|nr:FAD-dependent oxidoreductase [Verrucomicrobiota bacterium]